MTVCRPTRQAADSGVECGILRALWPCRRLRQPLGCQRFKHMRKRLTSKTLKQHFSIAWVCLPEKMQTNLYEFIRQIREVKSLEGSYIGCPDGPRYGPIEDGDGFTFLYKDERIAFCDILLSSSIVKVSQAYAISTILHELAHASDYFISPEGAMASYRFDAEVNAWDKAISWAKDGISDSVLVREIEFVAIRAKLRLSVVELTQLTKAAKKGDDF